MTTDTSTLHAQALARIEEMRFLAHDEIQRLALTIGLGVQEQLRHAQTQLSAWQTLKSVLELCTPRGFYELCGHDSHEEGVVVNETDEGYTCESLKYLVCAYHCGEYETDLCDNEHKHGQDEPFCLTADLIIKGVLGE